MKIILTKHVRERRKTGNIPDQRLWQFANYLIKCHKLESEIDGTYKFRKGGTQAIIVKDKQKFIFVTFFGPTGYIIEEDAEFGEFNCVYQSPEMLKFKEEKKARRLAKQTKVKKTKQPLTRLSQSIKDKLKRGTFEIIEIDKSRLDYLHARFGHKPRYLLVSKYDSYGFVELLQFDGVWIRTFRKDTWYKV